MSWRDRIRELVAAGVLIVTVGTGAVLSGGSGVTAGAIRIAAFNIQVFGQTKASNDSIMDVLARVVRSFDVVLVQEVRDRDELVADRFLDRINRDTDPPFAMIEGPRLGTTSSKEQYVIYYRPGIVSFVDSFTVPDVDQRFEREPLVARFQAGFFDFRLVGVHIKPDHAYDELAALAEVADALVDSTEGDVILLGDFNADCSYFRETDMSHPLKAASYHWVISDSARTAVASGCTYDRIVLGDGTYGGEYVPNTAQVYRYDTEFGITDSAFVRRVSDHFPIYAEFRITGPDDDGPGASVAPQDTAQWVASRQGQVYYRAGCDAARRLVPANVITFATEAQAQQAGYRRSLARGC